MVAWNGTINCVVRGTYCHERSGVESEIFRQHFQTTPLLVFFGNGEIGVTGLCPASLPTHPHSFQSNPPSAPRKSRTAYYLYSNATNIHPDLLPCRIPSTGATRSSHKQQDRDRDWNKVCFPWELNYIEGRWGWRKVDIGLLFSRERTGSLMFVSSKLCAVQALRQFCLFTIWGRRRW